MMGNPRDTRKLKEGRCIGRDVCLWVSWNVEWESDFGPPHTVGINRGGFLFFIQSSLVSQHVRSI